MPEGPDAYELSVTDGGIVRLSPRLREYHLTPETEGRSCVVQASGRSIRVWVWSEREDIRLNVQTDSFVVDRPYERSLHRWGINLSRYQPHLGVEDGTVEATVETFEGEMPDV
jgi:hypothetical protein